MSHNDYPIDITPADKEYTSQHYKIVTSFQKVNRVILHVVFNKIFKFPFRSATPITMNKFLLAWRSERDQNVRILECIRIILQLPTINILLIRN